MTTLEEALAVRREEFDAHFALAKALEDRMVLDDSSLGSISLSARHINTIKSGLLIHLYNIEEAIMTQALSYIGEALGSVEPRRWTQSTLREWLRGGVISRIGEGGEDGRLETVFASSNLLLGSTAPGPQPLKKPSGTWDDKKIALFLQRMDIECNLPASMWTRIRAAPLYGDRTPLQFLADRRNAIAHGRRSFEDGASDMQLADVLALSGIVLDYLGFIVQAFHDHVTTDAHVAPVT